MLTVQLLVSGVNQSEGLRTCGETHSGVTLETRPKVLGHAIYPFLQSPRRTHAVTSQIKRVNEGATKSVRCRSVGSKGVREI